MSSYRPTSVIEAGRILGPKAGLTWADNRQEIVDHLNRARNLWYNRYEERQLFDNVLHCFRPQLFRNSCGCFRDTCSRCYWGITLPREMAGIKTAWQWNYPLRLRDAWRESFTGLAPSGGAYGDLVEMREHFPTDRDLTTDSYLQVYAESLADTDKKVIVGVLTADNRSIKIEMVLQGDTATVASDVLVREVQSILLPEGRRGYITLATSTGYELGIYSPCEDSVPARKRYKLPGRCATNLLVQGTRQFVEVYFDTDLIEIGDRMVLEFMGTYFKYYESTDSREKAKASDAITAAWKQLDGVLSRDKGGRLPQPNFSPPRKCGLPGYTS